MPKEYKGDSLPTVTAQQGNPAGVLAEEDVNWNGVPIVKKGEHYSSAYLKEIEAGCAGGKPKAEANKVAQPSENK